MPHTPSARGKLQDRTSSWNLHQVKKLPEPEAQGFYCYIVECADGTLYTGWTNNLQRRVATHNAGRGSRYTKLRRPVRLVYYETFATRAQAMRREVEIKRMKRPAKLAQISNFKPPASAQAV